MISRDRAGPSLQGLAGPLCPGTIRRRFPPSETGDRHQPPSQSLPLPPAYPGLVVRLGAVAPFVVRGEVEGVDDALLVGPQAALHYEGVLLASHQVEVGRQVSIDVPGLAELSQT